MPDTLPPPLPRTGATPYRTAPDHRLDGMPPGIPYIIGNEAAERFSFYGMRAILLVFMTSYLVNRQGQLDVMDKNLAQAWFHQFVSAVYYLPVFGAILADGFLGKYRTILCLSVVYCLGHFALALNDTRVGLFVGLALISIGGGGIKPCVSANVGDQFGAGNRHLLSRAFGWFYIAINTGSIVSTYLCPILLNNKAFGPHFAFGLPGVLMLVATVIFWLGRKRFVHVPPAGLGFVRQTFGPTGLRAIGGLAMIYAFIIVFWALWDQSSGGEWTLQAKAMDLHLFGQPILPEQVQLANPLFILILVPVFNYGLYPAIERFCPFGPLRKIGVGLFLTSFSFVVIWAVQRQIDLGGHPSVWWQLPAYLLLTAGEVMVSITGLEFSYTQAPPSMKSAVMALWLFAVSLGNQFTSLLNFAVPWLRQHGADLDGANFFAFFSILMFVTAVAYVFASRSYRGRSYVQGTTGEEEALADATPALADGGK